MAKRWILLVAALAAVPAVAHDFWLQPRGFSFAEPRAVPLIIFVGHGPARQRWGVPLDHVIQFKSFGPGGTIDRKPELTLLSPEGDGTLKFTRPGTHLLAFQSTWTPSDLPAVRYTSYAREEGLTLPLEQRVRTGTTEANGRELYSRRAKAIIQIGPVDARQGQLATRRLGLSLEIVPERNPYALKPNERLPVRIFFEGKPLAGALVKLTNLDFDTRPVETNRSDALGRASFSVPDRGAWLINVIWSKPITGNPVADFQTTFSSLTFGYGARGLQGPATPPTQ